MGGNYAPAFESQKEANARGYDQNLWLIGENRQICEAGLMNFMVVRKREDGGAYTLSDVRHSSYSPPTLLCRR